MHMLARQADRLAPQCGRAPISFEYWHNTAPMVRIRACQTDDDGRKTERREV